MRDQTAIELALTEFTSRCVLTLFVINRWLTRCIWLLRVKTQSKWCKDIVFALFSVVWVRGNLMRHNCFFSVRLLSVLRDHSVFSSPPERPMTYDFAGFSIPDLIHYIFCPIFILQKEPVFPFLMLSAKQVYCWYHFYNVFGMTYINHIHTVIN